MRDSIPTALSTTEISEAAKLFRKESLRPLTEYQKRINEEAAQLALQNPVLIQRGHRHDLLERAREVVSASYQFKKASPGRRSFLHSRMRVLYQGIAERG